ncbi:MAG: YqcC family protein [Pseudomonadales bacterium]|nr:YqcC family protein [Pseudomonadales bacterium]MCP5167788.1 YqcC family protein [Pseudomonadales bacterium]
MRTQVAELLIDIEAELRQLGLWERQSPPAEALASEQPFCIDTLTLPQWLQFIFLPRLYRLLEQDAALPDRCGIAPLAEEYFRGTGLPSAGLEQILLRMDEVLSEGTGGGQ